MQRPALRINVCPVIYLTYSYSEGACVEAAHRIRRALEEWHCEIEMRPQPGELFLGKLNESDLADFWLVSEGALVVGVGLGGLAAALIQETTRPDLNVVCVSSPTSHGVIKLARRMSHRVALYSSQDSAIAGRVENWPNLAEAHDTCHLMHGAHLRPYELTRLILAHKAGLDLGAEMADLFKVRQEVEDAMSWTVECPSRLNSKAPGVTPTNALDDAVEEAQMFSRI